MPEPAVFTSCEKADNICLAEMDTLIELLKRSPNAEVLLVTNFGRSPVARKIENYLADRGIDTNRIVYEVDQENTASVLVLLQQ